jgi:hypothetical protein
MAPWALVLTPDGYEAERLYAHESVALPAVGPEAGDPVLLTVDSGSRTVFGLGRVTPDGDRVAYTHRLFDAPLPAGDLDLAGPGVHRLDPSTYALYSAKAGAEPARRTWLVSVDLPIEASTPAEAVRAFWTYVSELGPRELPAFVSPSGDELAMQAFVLGEEANLDPEEDED